MRGTVSHMSEKERTGTITDLDALDTAEAATQLRVSKRWVELRRANDPEFRALWHDIGSGDLHIWRIERPVLAAWFRSRCSSVAPAQEAAA